MSSLAMDTETTGSDFIHGCRPFLVTACDGSHNYYWEGSVDEDRTVTWEEHVLDDIRYTVSLYKEIVFHNSTFDVEALASIGIHIPTDKIQDTMIANHCLRSDSRKGLKYLAVKYYLYGDEDESLLKSAVLSARESAKTPAKGFHPHFPASAGVWQQDMWMAPKECLHYALCDVERTYILWKDLRSMMFRFGVLNAYRIRMQLVPIMIKMKYAGIHIYKDQMEADLLLIEEEQKNIGKQIKEELSLNRTLNLGTKADQYYLFVICLGMEEHKTEKGGTQLNKDTIKLYLEQRPNDSVIRLYARWSKLESRKGFIRTYIRWSHNSRIHPNTNICGTKETRQSSTDPNMQNVEKELKGLYLGPPPGKVWVDIDCVNIELCIWAYAVGNRQLIERFEAGESIHAMITKVVYPRTQSWSTEEIKDSIEYARCKAGNFARIYGGGDRKVNKTYGVADACERIDKAFPEIGAFMDSITKQAVLNRDLFGDYCIFTLDDYKLNVDPEALYKACNYYIQGSAGMIMHRMMIAINKLDGPFILINQVHDSLVFEMYERDLYFVPVLEQTMVKAGQALLPACAVDSKIIRCKYGPT